MLFGTFSHLLKSIALHLLLFEIHFELKRFLHLVYHMICIFDWFYKLMSQVSMTNQIDMGMMSLKVYQTIPLPLL